MTVYADEAFLLNGAVDYLLLICAAKLGGGRIARLRLLAAALFGGLYAAAIHSFIYENLRNIQITQIFIVVSRSRLCVCWCCGFSRTAVRDRRSRPAGRHVLRSEHSGTSFTGRTFVYALLYRLFLHGPARRRDPVHDASVWG
mgnify:CR=1 FL=1